ncbi:MAG: hypothetical protein KA184_20665 [Candidatus Hydrogenedentes bacterium]|nr:hypothetical protein [Candidatus Hydrogenedentota bacterium]
MQENENRERLEQWLFYAKNRTCAYIRAARAHNTERAYGADARTFEGYCEAVGASPSEPPSVDTVQGYFVWLADVCKVSAATLRRRLSGLRSVWDARWGSERHCGRDPRIAQLVEGIVRSLGRASQGSRALTLDDVRRLAAQCDRRTLRGRLAAALVLVGFAGGFRRSELAALRVEDLEFQRDRLLVFVRRSKTDQRSRGSWKAIRRGRPPHDVPAAGSEGLAGGGAGHAGPGVQGCAASGPNL